MGKCLVVTFGSRSHPGGVPTPAFHNTILQVQRESKIPFDVRYLLAWRNDWYMGGIRDLAESFDDAVVKLRELVAGRPSVFVGNSMGGYAALAFGCLVSATRVLAISPQTYFDARETRWPDLPRGLKSIYDLMHESDYQTLATLVVGASEPLDMDYANAIGELPCVNVLTYDKGGHDVGHFLRSKGELQRLVSEQVAEVVKKKAAA